MKYLIAIIIIVNAIFAILFGYLFIKPAPRTAPLDSKQISSVNLKDISARLDGLQKRIDELSEAFSKQSLFIQKTKEDNITDSARVITLENKFYEAVNNVQGFLTEEKQSSDQALLAQDKLMEQMDEQLTQSDLSPSPNDPPELTTENEPNEPNDKLNKRIANLVKNAQKKQWEEQSKRISKQLQQLTTRSINNFAVKNNLADYQKQAIVAEINAYSGNLLNLYSNLRDYKISSAAFASKRDAYREDIKNKLQQVLLPEQYNQYLKMEPALSKTAMQVLTQEIKPPK